MSATTPFAMVTRIAALVVLAILFLEIVLHARLARLGAEVREAVAAAGLVPAMDGDAIRTIRRGLNELHVTAAALNGLLADEQNRRMRLGESLRQTEERYALAVDGGNDGMWEWDLKSDAVFYSPRWKSMLGYAERELGESIDEWHSRIHPDDLDRTLAEIRAHLAGRDARLESEHRVRHRDGRYRWVLVRAQAVRKASGAPYRMVGLITDITPRREVQQVLLELGDGLAELSGESCYRAIVEKLATVVGVEEAFLTECCDNPATRVRMLAYWVERKFTDCQQFDLAGTPCENVIHGAQQVFMSRRVASRWPLESKYGTEGYLGMPCFDTSGVVIGHIACKSAREIRGTLPHHAILRLFAMRAAVEMERQRLQRNRTELLASGAIAAGGAS